MVMKSRLYVGSKNQVGDWSMVLVNTCPFAEVAGALDAKGEYVAKFGHSGFTSNTIARTVNVKTSQ